MVRLYVGGLPPNVDQEELAKRFSTFGTVTSCDYAVPKPQGLADFPPERRGFAYLEIEPAYEGSVSKCQSVYNHSKWKGHVLRVELARPDYLARLKQEWEDEAYNNEVGEAEEEAVVVEPEPPSTKALYFPIPGRKRKFIKAPLDCSLPDGTKRVKKVYFPPVAALGLDRLVWNVPRQTSMGSSIHKLNLLQYEPGKPYAPSPVTQRREDLGATIPMVYVPPVSKFLVMRPQETHEYLKVLKKVDSQSQRQALHDHQPSSGEQQEQQPGRGSAKAAVPKNVVEFLDDGAGIGYAQDDDMGRFDSDSDDDEGMDRSRGRQPVKRSAAAADEEAAADDDGDEEAAADEAYEEAGEEEEEEEVAADDDEEAADAEEEEVAGDDDMGRLDSDSDDAAAVRTRSRQAVKRSAAADDEEAAADDGEEDEAAGEEEEEEEVVDDDEDEEEAADAEEEEVDVAVGGDEDAVAHGDLTAGADDNEEAAADDDEEEAADDDEEALESEEEALESDEEAAAGLSEEIEASEELLVAEEEEEEGEEDAGELSFEREDEEAMQAELLSNDAEQEEGEEEEQLEEEEEGEAEAEDDGEEEAQGGLEEEGEEDEAVEVVEEATESHVAADASVRVRPVEAAAAATKPRPAAAGPVRSSMQGSSCGLPSAHVVREDVKLTPARPGAGSRPGLDLSRFGSDSEEDYRDVDSDEDKPAGVKARTRATAAPAAAIPAAAAAGAAAGRSELAAGPAEAAGARDLPVAAASRLQRSSRAGKGPREPEGTKSAPAKIHAVADLNEIIKSAPSKARAVAETDAATSPSAALAEVRGHAMGREGGAAGRADQGGEEGGPPRKAEERKGKRGRSLSAAQPAALLGGDAEAAAVPDEQPAALEKQQAEPSAASLVLSAGRGSPPGGRKVDAGWREAGTSQPHPWKSKEKQRGSTADQGEAAPSPPPPARKPIMPAAFSFSFFGDGGSALVTLPRTTPAAAAAAAADGKPLPRLADAWLQLPGGDPASASLLQGFGQAFVRPQDKSDEQVRAAWDAQREALAADYKSKQRTALKHAGRGGGGVGKKTGAPRRS